MNVRTITGFILTVVLTVSAAAGVRAAEESDSYPYTGPNTPVMTTA